MKLNKKTSIGLLALAVTFLAQHIVALPDFVCGLGMGLGIAFILLGFYSVNHDMSKFRALKLKLLNR